MPETRLSFDPGYEARWMAAGNLAAPALKLQQHGRKRGTTPGLSGGEK
jgi:hypothetical protein